MRRYSVLDLEPLPAHPRMALLSDHFKGATMARSLHLQKPQRFFFSIATPHFRSIAARLVLQREFCAHRQPARRTRIPLVLSAMSPSRLAVRLCFGLNITCWPF